MFHKLLFKFACFLAKTAISARRATGMTGNIDGITIYCRNTDFFDFYTNVLSILKSDDPLSYIRVKNNVSSIIETEVLSGGKKASFYFGCYTKTFYDDFKMKKRKEVGYRYVAAYLLRYAIRIRLFHGFHQKKIGTPSYDKKYMKLSIIAVKKELNCSKSLKCSDLQIQYIQNWLSEAQARVAALEGQAKAKPKGSGFSFCSDMKHETNKQQ